MFIPFVDFLEGEGKKCFACDLIKSIQNNMPQLKYVYTIYYQKYTRKCARIR